MCWHYNSQNSYVDWKPWELQLEEERSWLAKAPNWVKLVQMHWYQDNIVMANLNLSNFSGSVLSTNESGSNPLNPWILVKTYAFTFWNARCKRPSFLPEDIMTTRSQHLNISGCCVSTCQRWKRYVPLGSFSVFAWLLLGIYYKFL